MLQDGGVSRDVTWPRSFSWLCVNMGFVYFAEAETRQRLLRSVKKEVSD